MENNIELYDRYILGEMTSKEEAAFKERLSSDAAFLQDFRIYLFTVRGIRQEEEQDCIELAVALKKLSRDQLLKIIGRRKAPKVFRLRYLRERMAWAASVAILLIIGVAVVFQVDRSSRNRLDNTLFAYNYVSTPSRDGEHQAMDLAAMPTSEVKAAIPSLKLAYENAPEDDLEEAEQAGMTLAMAYLKIHDRKQARAVLEEMCQRFADDTEFTARCRNILNQLK